MNPIKFKSINRKINWNPSWRRCFSFDLEKTSWKRCFSYDLEKCSGNVAFHLMWKNALETLARWYSNTKLRPIPRHRTNGAPMGLQWGEMGGNSLGEFCFFLISLLYCWGYGVYIIPKWRTKVPGHIAILFKWLRELRKFGRKLDP